MASLKLLIVEDDIASLELMAEVFTSLKADVRPVNDSREAAGDTPWIDPKPAQALFGVHYRVTAYNADGKPSAPSAER